jgi:ribosomal protein S27AE
MQPVPPEQQDLYRTILNKKHEIDQARREKQRRAMDKYDETVYYPSHHENREACGKIGHKFGSWMPNPLGTWLYRTCPYCGEMEKQD